MIFYKLPLIQQRFMWSKRMDPFRNKALTWKSSGFTVILPLNPDEHHVQSCWSRLKTRLPLSEEGLFSRVCGRMVMVMMLCVLSPSLSPTFISCWFQLADRLPRAFSADAHLCGAHRNAGGRGWSVSNLRLSHSAPEHWRTLKNTKTQQKATRFEEQWHDGLVGDDQV